MVTLCEQGNDIVYGVKTSRKKDSFMKRTTAVTFYKLQEMMGVKVIFNHADFRLLKKEAVERLAHYHEKNLYLRGLMPTIGHKIATVSDVINEREAGKSKYTLRKMLHLAADGIFSFSTRPISYIFGAGILFILAFIGTIIYILYSLISGHVVQGWASIMASLWLIGGFIMLALLGVIGIRNREKLVETGKAITGCVVTRLEYNNILALFLLLFYSNDKFDILVDRVCEKLIYKNVSVKEFELRAENKEAFYFRFDVKDKEDSFVDDWPIGMPALP